VTQLTTTHRVLPGDARVLSGVADASIHLVVTSPPYPMIEMWDGMFGEMAPSVAAALASGEGFAAFEAMHAELDRVWSACCRVLVPGGIACINIGDATRTIDGDFSLFPNHARIVHGMTRAGLTPLPDIVWRKPTNAPNKFMGSGMLPPGAYVTYEHESILIFRKGGKRPFASVEEKAARRRSAFFWEERNLWFSDVWMDLVGARQDLDERETRARSAAFPFELPWRLVQMFSVQGDVVLDPFAGTGTTAAAALASARSSVSVERDAALAPVIARALRRAAEEGRIRTQARLEAHRDFVEQRQRSGHAPTHVNQTYGFPVVTGQEEDLVFLEVTDLQSDAPDSFRATHGQCR
jgi:DNA modification methylase